MRKDNLVGIIGVVLTMYLWQINENEISIVLVSLSIAYIITQIDKLTIDGDPIKYKLAALKILGNKDIQTFNVPYKITKSTLKFQSKQE